MTLFPPLLTVEYRFYMPELHKLRSTQCHLQLLGHISSDVTTTGKLGEWANTQTCPFDELIRGNRKHNTERTGKGVDKSFRRRNPPL